MSEGAQIGKTSGSKYHAYFFMVAWIQDALYSFRCHSSRTRFFGHPGQDKWVSYDTLFDLLNFRIGSDKLYHSIQHCLT